MKQFTLLALLIIFNACNKTNDVKPENPLIGNWAEFENYISPGSISSWKPANNITINLNENLTYTTDNSNYYWGSSGNIQNVTDSTFVLKSSLTSNPLNCKYKISNDILEIWYPCTEGCGSRFKRK